MDLVPVDALSARSLVAVDTPYGRFAIAKVGDSFYAFPDSCTHASCPLSEGHLAGQVLTCECHFSDFDVTTGRVLTEPAESDLTVAEIQPTGPMLTIDERRLAEMMGAEASPAVQERS
jgi:3-phenylpropionate/trans-cinnamate dioxygenase ferredoxin subunit